MFPIYRDFFQPCLIQQWHDLSPTGPEDSVESIKEVFGFTPSEEDIEDDLEIVAAAKDVKRDVEDKPKKSFMGK